MVFSQNTLYIHQYGALWSKKERERVNNKLAKNWKGFYLAMPPSGALWTTAQISISGTFLKKFWTSLLTEFGEGAASSSPALAGRKSNFPLCQQAFNLYSYYQLHIYIQGRPSGPKSTSATSGLSDFLLQGAQTFGQTFGAGQKTNQCHGTVALARWAPFYIYIHQYRYYHAFLRNEISQASF